LFGIRDLLLAGKISAAILYSCDAAMLASEDEDISYFIPEEGAPLWLDSFAILREAPNREMAHKFINFMCQPEVAAENANYVWYKPPVKGAEQWMTEDLVGDEALNPPESILQKCAFHAAATAARENAINQGMKKILDRIRESSRLAGIQE
jgi:spermidine/putrescine-binding protein